MRWLIKLGYKGTAYHGWQKQTRLEVPTVQGVLEEKITLLWREPISLVGCGRTDTGVHASTYYAHFDADQPLPERFLQRVNGMLPTDIALYEIKEVASSFHARFSAWKRAYEYHVSWAKNPFSAETVTRLYQSPNLTLMNQVAQHMLGVHQFRCFCKGSMPDNNYRCEVFEAYWKEEGEHGAVFYISANRFLRNMVRAVVGSLLDVSAGRIDEGEFKSMLSQGSRSQAGKSVSARGLFLTEVHYH